MFTAFSSDERPFAVAGVLRLRVSAYDQVKFGISTPSRNRSPWSRANIIYSIFGLLAVTNVFSLVALFMAPDIATLFNRQDERAFSAYEERILQLRMEVDRLHSRQYRQEGDLNLQMQELTQQQEFLAEQHRYVRILAEKAAEMGLANDNFEIASVDPDPAAIITGSISSTDEAQGVAEISQSIDDMLADSRQALASISDAAEESTDEIMNGLNSVGISLTLDGANDAGTGGPFLPATETFDSESLAESANGVLDALTRFQQAREGLAAAPIHYPFASHYRVSSVFGNRRDPFNGSSAFHSGLDIAAPAGTSVLAAGDGRVSFAGQKSGYGNVVEISHAGGTISRYAHLSAILVSVGAHVKAGDVVARVGSTGRSTGPHLHFELRRNNTPQNPVPYLNLAKTLSAYLI